MKGIYRFWAGLALCAALPFVGTTAAAQDAAPAAAPAESPPPPIAARNFAGRPAFWDGKLSPDGTKFSFMRQGAEATQIVVTEIATGKLVRAFASGPTDELQWYRWVSTDKLLLSISSPGKFYDQDARYLRLVLVELATGVMTRLFPRSNVLEADNVIHVAKDGSYILVAIQPSVTEFPAVMRHELKPDGKITTVQAPRDGVFSWVADDKGVVRMGTAFVRGQERIYYRPVGSTELVLVPRPAEERGWEALHIDGDTDFGYVLSEGENGRVALRRFDFAKREVLETVFEHPEWDIDSVAFRKGKPYAAFYTAERDEVHWFDPATAKEYRALRRALGDGEVWVTSRAEDESKILVYAGNESDPGVLYLFDPVAGAMKEISQFRPELDFRALAKPKPVQYTARDGTVINGFLTLPRGRQARGLPLVLMPHGGPYGIRDKLEYNDEVQLLANRGYAVLQPNYRGSGGYGEALFEAGAGEIGRKMQDDIDDAMDWAVAQGIADPARVCVVGGSYGGYAALWSVLRNPERYRCAASWAGVTDWNKMLIYDRRYLATRVNKWWSARVRGDGKSQDLDQVSPYRTAGQLSRPVLLAHGTKDQRVPIAQYNIFEKAARTAPVPPQTLVIEGEGHSFSKPENARAWYEALESFLARHNPADPAPATASAATAPESAKVPAAAP
ncbi:MAG: alpha/beta fold hydrolase [Porphyrobacter sp.]|nr:alpha/beta fold hydrolase [Porphyrobacter sp.]